jgi:hypothetical protein
MRIGSTAITIMKKIVKIDENISLGLFNRNYNDFNINILHLEC